MRLSCTRLPLGPGAAVSTSASMVKSVKLLPGYAINPTSLQHCAVAPPTGRKHGADPLWSHCSFLRDAGAATVQLAPAWNLAGRWKFLTDACGISIRQKEEFLHHTHNAKCLKGKKMPLWSLSVMNYYSRLFRSLCITLDMYKSLA